MERAAAMNQLDELQARISELRKCIHRLIDEKGNLLDSEVLEASRMLDNALNEYEAILNKKRNSSL